MIYNPRRLHVHTFLDRKIFEVGVVRTDTVDCYLPVYVLYVL
ncbi:hypothetical protein Hanom_Chr15g01382861 [Helianthus anomalus]